MKSLSIVIIGYNTAKYLKKLLLSIQEAVLPHDIVVELIYVDDCSSDNSLNLFDSFEGYVDFFLLQDLVTSDYSSIKYLIPFESFENYPLPNDIEEYKQYKYNLSNFVSARSQRIKSFNK